MMFKFSFKLFIHLSCEILQTKVLSLKKLFKKIFLLSTFIKRYYKSLQNPFLMGSKSRQSPIHFPSLCCHQGISVPRKALEIKSYLWFTPTTQVLLLTCQGHTFMRSTVDAPILISSPFNQQIIFGLAIHHFLHCSHPMEFKRSFFPSASQFYLTTKPQTIVLFSMIQSTKHFQCSPLNASPCPLHYI
jgi:hypothetical protein